MDWMTFPGLVQPHRTLTGVFALCVPQQKILEDSYWSSGVFVGPCFAQLSALHRADRCSGSSHMVGLCEGRWP